MNRRIKKGSKREAPAIQWTGNWEEASYIASIFLACSFFFVYPYSHATYIDHGGVHFIQFPVHSRREGPLQAPLCPLPRPVPRESGCPPRESQRKRQRESAPVPLLLFCQCHERGGGQEQCQFLPGPPLVPSASASAFALVSSSPLLPLPDLSLRRLAPRVAFLFHSRHYLPNVRRGKEIQYRLTAPLVGEGILDLPPALHLPVPCV